VINQRGSMMAAVGVIDLVEHRFVPRKAADCGRLEGICRNQSRLKLQDRQFAAPLVKNVPHPPVMDGYKAQGIFVPASAARPLEHAHCDFVRRAEKEQADNPQTGKIAQHVSPERPREHRSRILETRRRPGRNEPLNQFSAKLPLLRGIDLAGGPLTVALAEPPINIGVERSLVWKSECGALQIAIERKDGTRFKMPVGIRLVPGHQLKRSQGQTGAAGTIEQ
jgi:hypothetical protein